MMSKRSTCPPPGGSAQRSPRITPLLRERLRRLRRLRSDERGITLVELLVYSILTVIILGALAAFIINSFNADRAVTSHTDATNSAQLLATAVQTGVRNSSGIQVQEIGSSTLVTVRTAGFTEVLSWQCQAWFFDLDKGEVRTRTSSGPIVAPNADTLGSWALLAQGVSKDPDLPLVTVTDSALSLNFDVYISDNRAVEIRTSATSRVSIEESAPCF